MSKRSLFCLFSFCVLPAFLQSASAKVWINEVMQSNIDGIVDDLHDFPDSWLELYNDGDEDINLRNWYISETSDYSQGWKIPQTVIIPAKGFVILYFDKAGQGLHAHFRIDSGKTSLYLFNASQEEEDRVEGIPKQAAPGIARGRIPDGGDLWLYFIQATPGSSNEVEGNVSLWLAPDPVFSQPGGVSESEVTLVLSLPQDAPGEILAEHIHYTIDGSEPTEDSPVYQNALTFTQPNANAPYGLQATVVKAKVIAPGFLINRSVAHTYIITNRSLDLPIISLSLDSRFLFDDEFGIYTNGNGKYGKSGNCTDRKVNWNNNWRRPANIEYFPSQDQTSVINQLGEIRIAGGCSRGHPQKSLIVYGNKRFGVSRFNYQLFNEKPGQEIRSFMLRNSGNDFGQTHFRDAATHLFMGGKVDLDYQAYQPAILLINGEYYGIENIRERSNEDFVLANYDGLEDIDMMERTAQGWELKTGDWAAYNIMNERIKAPTEQLSYEELAGFVDIEEFINYNILQMYVVNTDYPHNNVVMWRPNNEANAKWRYILKDTDFGLGHTGASFTYNSFISHFLSGNDDTRMLRRLLDKPQFRESFIEHFAIYLGDLLYKDYTSALIDSLQQHIQPEVPYHRKRFGIGGDWNNEVSKMRNWVINRNEYLYRYMSSYFGLKRNSPMTLTISPEVTGVSSIAINDIQLRKHAFDGQYFWERPLHIRWEGDPDSNFLGWKIAATVRRAVTTVEIHEPEIEYSIPENCTEVQFMAISKETSDISRINVTSGSSIRAQVTNEGIIIANLAGLSTISLVDASGRLIDAITTNKTSVDFPIQGTGLFLVKITNRNETVTVKVLK